MKYVLSILLLSSVAYGGDNPFKAQSTNPFKAVNSNPFLIAQEQIAAPKVTPCGCNGKDCECGETCECYNTDLLSCCDTCDCPKTLRWVDGPDGGWGLFRGDKQLGFLSKDKMYRALLKGDKWGPPVKWKRSLPKKKVEAIQQFWYTAPVCRT